jgi:hypothetical protein
MNGLPEVANSDSGWFTLRNETAFIGRFDLWLGWAYLIQKVRSPLLYTPQKNGLLVRLGKLSYRKKLGFGVSSD